MAALANFDVADIYQEHAYLVRLTKGRDAKVQVFEVFGRPPTEREAQWAPETVLRCEAAREVWDVVSPEARAEFNRHLKAEGKPAGRWGADETAVQRLFGKELLVLLWAVELPDVKPDTRTTPKIGFEREVRHHVPRRASASNARKAKPDRSSGFRLS